MNQKYCAALSLTNQHSMTRKLGGARLKECLNTVFPLLYAGYNVNLHKNMVKNYSAKSEILLKI